MFKNVDKGPSLGLHIVLRESSGPFPKGAGTLKRRQGQGKQMCRAGLRKALKACFSGKKVKPCKIGLQINLTRCRKALGTKFWSILKPPQSKNFPFNPKNLK